MSMNNFFQFLSSMPSGTGQAMADVMIEVLSEWGVKNCIKALSFDTTSSNTGRKNGACMLVEMQLRKKVFYLAGRHHIHEILLEEAFIQQYTGHDNLLFKRQSILEEHSYL